MARSAWSTGTRRWSWWYPASTLHAMFPAPTLSPALQSGQRRQAPMRLHGEQAGDELRSDAETLCVGHDSTVVVPSSRQLWPYRHFGRHRHVADHAPAPRSPTHGEVAQELIESWHGTCPVCPAASCGLGRDDTCFLDRLVLELGVVQVRVHPAAASSSSWRPRSTMRPSATTRTGRHRAQSRAGARSRLTSWPRGPSAAHADRHLGLRVEMGGGLVEDDHVRCLEQEASEGYALFLATGEPYPRSPTTVSRPSGSDSMKGRICAPETASWSSSSVASGFA